MKPFDLSGKVALVTGARTGLGQAMAVALAEAGADIIGLGSQPMAETKQKIAQLGGHFEELHCDLSVDADFEYLAETARGKEGRIDILVNAGTIHRADILDVTKAEWDRVMNINLRSVFFLAQAVARHMINSRILLMVEPDPTLEPEERLRRALRRVAAPEFLTTDYLSLRLQLWSLAQAHHDFEEINTAAQKRYRAGLAALIRAARPGLTRGECNQRRLTSTSCRTACGSQRWWDRPSVGTAGASRVARRSR